MSLWRRNARFNLPAISSYGNCYFKAIPSNKVEIDISCEILLNLSLSRSTFHVRFYSVCRFRAETRGLVYLRCVVTETVILKRFRIIRSRTTFPVKFYSVCRFRAETLVLVYLRCVVTETVILQRFQVIRSRSTFHVRFCSVSLWNRKTRFSQPTISTYRNYFFEAIPSHKVKIDI